MFPEKFFYLEEKVPGPRIPCIIALKWERPFLKFGNDPDYLKERCEISEEKWKKFSLAISSLKLVPDSDDLSCDGKQIYCELKINGVDIKCSLLSPSFPDYLIFREQLNTLTKSKNYPEGLLIDDEDFEEKMKDE